MIDLAQQIVRDGEGASKFITVRVNEAENDTAARNIAFSIANSPLVKTALLAKMPIGGALSWRLAKRVKWSRAFNYRNSETWAALFAHHWLIAKS